MVIQTLKCDRENEQCQEKLTTEEFKQKARQVHGDKYDYDYVEYKNARIKVKIICPEHGPFEQIPYTHLNGVGCPFCSDKTSTKEEFKRKAREVHGDWYDYDHVDYVDSSTKVTIVCLEHGTFLQTPSGHLNGNGCPECAIGFKEYHANKWLEENPERHHEPCNVYLIKMYNDTESFLKLGITTKSVDKRYSAESSRGGYLYEIIKEQHTTKKNAVLTELKAKEYLDGYSHQPQIQFDGWTECFTPEVQNDIEDLMDSV